MKKTTKAPTKVSQSAETQIASLRAQLMTQQRHIDFLTGVLEDIAKLVMCAKRFDPWDDPNGR